MEKYEVVKSQLKAQPKRWLITGVAGFIGSNLLETLLDLGQYVIGLDDYSTGKHSNLSQVRDRVGDSSWKRFSMIEGDICNRLTCTETVQQVDYVLHQAAVGSVPRSLKDPIKTNDVNVSGFLNILYAAHAADVSSFVYAASSSTYGDHPDLPKIEEKIGRPLSPYAVTKYVNEVYADVFQRCYGFDSIGLRYFNVFGARQDPNGAYAAVIPKWTSQMIKGEAVTVNGDGMTSRDFCYVENTVQMNILAATAPPEARNQIYNVAYGDRTSLNSLHSAIVAQLARNGIDYNLEPLYRDFRAGDVRHSQASIQKAATLLRYSPQYDFLSGLEKTMPWYIEHLA